MGLFDLIGDIISLPLDVLSDTSRAIQGKDTGYTKRTVEDIGDDLSDIFDI